MQTKKWPQSFDANLRQAGHLQGICAHRAKSLETKAEIKGSHADKKLPRRKKTGNGRYLFQDLNAGQVASCKDFKKIKLYQNKNSFIGE